MDTAVCGVLLENGILLEFGSVYFAYMNRKRNRQRRARMKNCADHWSRRTANDLCGELFMACLQCMDWKEIEMRRELVSKRSQLRSVWRARRRHGYLIAHRGEQCRGTL